MKIALCMICGNEEGVILRCLESAREAFDELCLVRAIGEAEPDRTYERAHLWCSRNGKNFSVEEFENEQPGLPHVDDFAAARNLSFRMADAADWILWLDCDDTLEGLNAARIREAVRVCPDEYNAIFANYQIERNGAVISRERLIRVREGRPMGRWKNAVHETCVIAGKAMDCPQIVVTHGDHGHKHRSSAERNARLLLGQLEDVPRNLFYAHTETKMAGEREKSRYYAHAALAALAANQVEERYTVLLNLSDLEPEKREEHLLAAARLQPWRREAWAYLCQAALCDGRRSEAVSYFRMMDALPLPEPLPWTHQGWWYGPGRKWLRVQCLRASGRPELIAIAETEHEENLQDPDYRDVCEGRTVAA